MSFSATLHICCAVVCCSVQLLRELEPAGSRAGSAARQQLTARTLAARARWQRHLSAQLSIRGESQAGVQIQLWPGFFLLLLVCITHM
jgi:hypothetical protein